jgi:hypothetical protein
MLLYLSATYVYYYKDVFSLLVPFATVSCERGIYSKKKCKILCSVRTESN